MQLALPLVGVALALLTGAAHGAPETCDECPGRVWYVDASAPGGGGQNGKSWASAYRNLNTALGQISSGDCIWVARGRYFTTSGTKRSSAFDLDRSVRLYGGFAGDEQCFSQRAGFFKQTRLSGEIGLPGPADNSYNVIRMTSGPPPGETLEVVIDGFNIRDANNDLGIGEGGGVVLALVESARIENCSLRYNRAKHGAGLHVRGTGLDVVRTEFIGNRAKLDGGGLFTINVESAANGTIGATLHNVVFKDNVAEGRGGAFFVADMPLGRQVLFVNALFRGNSAGKGGAGYLSEVKGGLLGYKNPGLATLVNATVADNSASTLGAAFVVEEASVLPAQLFLENSILWNNSGAMPAIGASPFGFSTVFHTLLQPGSPWACVPSPPCTSSSLCDSFACDPLFGAAYHPSSGSPAVDQGWPFGPPDTVDLDGDNNTSEPIPLDLDDLPRRVGIIDRGAYEYQGP